MDYSDFSILIGRLERQADDRPQWYAAKVALVAALGYAALALLALAILAVCFFIVAAIIEKGRPSIGLVLAGVAAVSTLIAMIRALWVRIDEPAGRQLTAEEAPQLFARIAEIAARMGGVPIQSVTINGEFNASIRQVPQWGVFGNYRNHLQLGVPLLAALTVEEFTAVLAHEMGHLGAQHGKFSAWIYRQRVTWHALERKLAEPSNLFQQALASFYQWYAPYFYAYSFVLGRAQEYAADRAAAQITQPQIVGRALTKLQLISRFLAEVFWERFFAHIEKSPEPPYRPFSIMPRAFKVAEKEWSRRDWLLESLKHYAADDDTHPSLAERLAALDLQPELPKCGDQPSALTLLGPATAALIHHCDEEWRNENLASWKRRHDVIREARWKIAEYEKYELSQLAPQDLWAKAELLFSVNRYAEGVEALQALVARDGKFPKAHLMLGQLLIERGDERGLEHLIMVAKLDAELARTAGAVGYTHLVNRGRKGEAQRFWQRISAAVDG